MLSNTQINNKIKRGFTLVELLVVISIIAMLLSILLPSLQKARDAARGTVCGARQKQLGLGLMAYAENFDGYIPPYSTKFKKGAQKGEPEGLWISNDGKRRYPNLKVEEEYWYAILYVTKGLEDRDVFFCPGSIPNNNSGNKDIQKQNLEKTVSAWTLGLREWNPPAPNGELAYVYDRAPRKLSSIQRPSEFFLLSDSVCLDMGTRYTARGHKYGQIYVIGHQTKEYYSFSGIHLRHGNKAGAIFADGHVSRQDYAYWCNLQRAGNPEEKYHMVKGGYNVIDQKIKGYWKLADENNYTGEPVYTKFR